MNLSAAVQEYLIEIEVRKHTPKTIRSYRNNLNLFLHFCNEVGHITEIEELTTEIVRKFTKYLIEKGRKGKMYEGRELIVASDKVKTPKRLRYLYSKPWIGSLYSEDSVLPLDPFEVNVEPCRNEETCADLW